ARRFRSSRPERCAKRGSGSSATTSPPFCSTTAGAWPTPRRRWEFSAPISIAKRASSVFRSSVPPSNDTKASAMIAIFPLLVVFPLGEQEKPPQTAQMPEPAKADAALSRYVLGPQDQLRITVFDEPDLTNSYRVEGDGFITFPLINRVAAAGLTPAELQNRIR